MSVAVAVAVAVAVSAGVGVGVGVGASVSASVSVGVRLCGLCVYVGMCVCVSVLCVFHSPVAQALKPRALRCRVQAALALHGMQWAAIHCPPRKPPCGANCLRF